MKKIFYFILLLIVTISMYNFSVVKIIYIQPLGYVKNENIVYLKKSIEKFYRYKCVVKKPLNFSKDILADSKTRYDASKILKKYKSNINLLIITEKDIAFRKSDKYTEWGIFGLGYRPGSTCVVSTYRLGKKVERKKMLERFEKVAIHEIGHNIGLEHCKYNKECLMNDANGTIRQVDNEKLSFCAACKNKIK